jgi:hypothetical protein
VRIPSLVATLAILALVGSLRGESDFRGDRLAESGDLLAGIRIVGLRIAVFDGAFGRHHDIRGSAPGRLQAATKSCAPGNWRTSAPANWSPRRGFRRSNRASIRIFSSIP